MPRKPDRPSAAETEAKRAVFVGGFGGHFAAGGGGGGVVSQEFIDTLGPNVVVSLDGLPAQGVGGGGGGGGVLIPASRKVTKKDLAQDFRVVALVPANEVIPDGALYILKGAGWEYYSVESVPCVLTVRLFCTISIGRISQDKELELKASIVDVSGIEIAETPIFVPEKPNTVSKLRRFYFPLEFVCQNFGEYKIVLEGAERRLAEVEFLLQKP